MNPIPKILEKYFVKIIFIFYSVIMAYLFLLSISSTSIIGFFTYGNGENAEYATEHTFYLADRWWLHIAVILVVIGLIFILIKKSDGILKCLNNKDGWLISIMSLIVFVSGVCFIFGTELLPRSDQRYLMETASQMVKGDFSAFETGNYLFVFPYQRSMVLLYYVLTVIFGDKAYLSVQVFNLICLLLIYYLVVRMIKSMWSKESSGSLSVVTYFVIMLFVPSFFYITFIYGNIPGLLFVLLSVFFAYRYMESPGTSNVVLSCMCMGIGLEFKNIYCIMLIALILILVCHLPKANKKWKTAAFIVLLPASYLAAGVFSRIVTEAIIQMPLSEGSPLITTVAMGFQEGSLASGWWNGYNKSVYVDHGYDGKAATFASIQSIKDSLNRFLADPGFAINFFSKKIASMWNNPTFEGFSILGERESGGKISPLMWKIIRADRNEMVIAFLNFFQSFVYAGNLLFLWFKRKTIQMRELFLPLSFVGAFFFFLVWEAKCQYAIPYFVMSIPYAVAGYGYFLRAEKVKISLSAKSESIFTRRRVLCLAGILALCLCMSLFSRTKLFVKTIGLNDDNETYYYHKQQDELRFDE